MHDGGLTQSLSSECTHVSIQASLRRVFGPALLYKTSCRSLARWRCRNHCARCQCDTSVLCTLARFSIFLIIFTSASSTLLTTVAARSMPGSVQSGVGSGWGWGRAATAPLVANELATQGVCDRYPHLATTFATDANVGRIANKSSRPAAMVHNRTQAKVPQSPAESRNIEPRHPRVVSCAVPVKAPHCCCLGFGCEQRHG
jgi:hypothetical protein